MTLHMGMISGTSMDAIDVALVDFSGAPLTLVAAQAYPWEPGLKQRIAALIDAPKSVTLDAVGRVDVEAGEAFARAALDLLAQAGVAPHEVAAIGSHGQTLRHQPQGSAPFTWQIADPNIIAERTGVAVVADFRRRDMAAGGQGAPLLPVFHDHVFRSDAQDRVIANLGGIANITVLRRGVPVSGFDTGPANRLLDAWIARHQGREYDAGGAWAAGGHVDLEMLASMLAEPYFKLPPPKSTGRELFNMAWLEAQIGKHAHPPEDIQATLQQLTAVTVAEAAQRCAPGAALYACGGGAHNAGLLAAIAAVQRPAPVATTEALGLHPDFVEAIAFAWFAMRTLAGQTSSSPEVTGARGARVLGAIYARTTETS